MPMETRNLQRPLEKADHQRVLGEQNVVLGTESKLGHHIVDLVDPHYTLILELLSILPKKTNVAHVLGTQDTDYGSSNGSEQLCIPAPALSSTVSEQLPGGWRTAYTFLCSCRQNRCKAFI